MDEIVIDTRKKDSLSAGELFDYKQRMQHMYETLEELQNAIYESFKPEVPLQLLVSSLENMRIRFETQMQSNIENILSVFNSAISDVSFPILSLYTTGTTEEEKAETEKTNEKIITEIFQPDAEKKIDINESPIIVLSPVNEKVLRYLSENPEAFYQLSGKQFEIVMTEIYSKLGYDVIKTKDTRDGGKDIIIRKPEILGDFIYYVECKKHNAKRPVGVGIVKNLIGTVNTDRVNGGILATTSFFSKDARKYILDNNLSYQIKMQDYNEIQKLLNQAILP